MRKTPLRLLDLDTANERVSFSPAKRDFVLYKGNLPCSYNGGVAPTCEELVGLVVGHHGMSVPKLR